MTVLTETKPVEAVTGAVDTVSATSESGAIALTTNDPVDGAQAHTKSDATLGDQVVDDSLSKPSEQAKLDDADTATVKLAEPVEQTNDDQVKPDEQVKQSATTALLAPPGEGKDEVKPKKKRMSILSTLLGGALNKDKKEHASEPTSASSETAEPTVEASAKPDTEPVTVSEPVAADKETTASTGQEDTAQEPSKAGEDAEAVASEATKEEAKTKETFFAKLKGIIATLQSPPQKKKHTRVNSLPTTEADKDVLRTAAAPTASPDATVDQAVDVPVKSAAGDLAKPDSPKSDKRSLALLARRFSSKVFASPSPKREKSDPLASTEIAKSDATPPQVPAIEVTESSLDGAKEKEEQVNEAERKLSGMSDQPATEPTAEIEAVNVPAVSA
ncbi:uncharacterized protein L969DRAFT_24375 [Mixia osmundae IAM 14324]|uniref:Uncharacterized protein n=1 Tax=Mixia osmundae (strain CBS 9802 / IAM 14324 / JCM 22182 / KY 12970) TaxID=764103 RepID=G7E159_MIXOS|nr:uncharacterized protein L969DRAFT_24375 [Mixia osmundae IAM 14324]KEI38792.1 hypothetical protein L969DRAFT_24375 [Mixia osmundae IAM 14324]GAA96569.1 hypothetical protein E5Q_03238 [Mixia osmundae IAM 14324]